MNKTLQIILIITTILFLLTIIILLKKKKLEIRYSLLWIGTDTILLILGIFPGKLENAIRIMGVYEVTNGLFALALLFVLIMLLYLTVIVSKLAKQNKDIAQRNALLEKEIEDINAEKK